MSPCETGPIAASVYGLKWLLIPQVRANPRTTAPRDTIL